MKELGFCKFYEYEIGKYKYILNVVSIKTDRFNWFITWENSLGEEEIITLPLKNWSFVEFDYYE